MSILSRRERRWISLGSVPVNNIIEIFRCKRLVNDVKLGKLPENKFPAKSIVVNDVMLTKLVGTTPLNLFPRRSRFSVKRKQFERNQANAEVVTYWLVRLTELGERPDHQRYRAGDFIIR